MSAHSAVLVESGLSFDDFNVYYGNKRVSNGEKMTANETVMPSAVTWTPQPGVLYTLLMTDLDAPGAKEEWLHWLLINIRGNNLGSAHVVQPYQGPTPPPSSGNHRYKLWLFQQRGTINSSDAADPPRRSDFSTPKFAQTHNLSLQKHVFFTVDSNGPSPSTTT